MIDAEAIRAQARKAYRAYLASRVSGESVFPYELRFARVQSGEATRRYADLKRELTLLKEGSDERGGLSYRVEWEERRDRLAGTQVFPVRIYFPDGPSLLGYLRKAKEAEAFDTDLSLILRTFPCLRGWSTLHPDRIIAHHGEWERLLAAAAWLRSNPNSGLFLREIPVVEDTKFVETHKPILKEILEEVGDTPVEERDLSLGFEDRYGLRRQLPLVRLSILDRNCAEVRFSGVQDISIPLDALNKLDFPEIRTVLIFENKTNFSNAEAFLSLPALAGTIAVFGSGFAVKTLGSIEWIRLRRIVYWGDIDTQGFRILAALRSHFVHCESILMDFATFDHFPQFHCTAPKDASQPPEPLTADEALLFARLVNMEGGKNLGQ
jgi:hypothetical protein